MNKPVKKETGQVNLNKWIAITAILCILCAALTYFVVKSSESTSDTPFLLDKGLKHSKETVELNVYETIKSIDDKWSSKPHLRPLLEAVKSVPYKIRGLDYLINDLRTMITDESGGLYTTQDHKSKWAAYGFKKFTVTKEKELDGIPVGRNNSSTVYRIMINKGKAEKLKAEIIKTRNELLKLVEDLVKTADTIEGVRFNKDQIEKLKKELVLVNPEGEAWTKNTFGASSVASVYPLLRKFENDAINSTAQIVNIIESSVSRNNFDIYSYKDDVISLPRKTCISKGETFETEIAIGHINNQSDFTVSVNGISIPVKDAKAKYTTVGANIGTQRYTATVTVKNPKTGKEETVKKDFEFEVGLPASK